MKLETHDIWVAFSLLTRLPVPVDHARAGERGAQAAWVYPLVGAALGYGVGLVGWAMLGMGVAAGITAVLVLALQVWLTGAMHEDGLADMADGLGGNTQVRRLEIMKDSRIGAYGTIAIVLALLARHSAISDIPSYNLPIILATLGAGSRALMVVVMASLNNARKSGLSASAGKPEFGQVLLALAIGLILSLYTFGWAGFVVFGLMALAALAVASLANKAFGGQTGDVLGATQQSAEIIGFAAL